MRSFIIVIWVLASWGFGFGQSAKKISDYPLNLPTAEYFATRFAFNNDSIAPVGKNKSFQYLNTHTNKPVFDKLFEEAYPFDGKYALVKAANKYGIISRNGDYLIKPEFWKFSFFSGLLFDSGIFFNDTSFFDFREGKLRKGPDGISSEPIPGDIYPYEESGKYGLVFKNGEKSKPIYDSVIVQGHFVAIVIKNAAKLKPVYSSINGDYVSDVVKGGKIGVINSSGKIVAPVLFTAAVIGQWHGYNSDFSYALKDKNSWHYFISGRQLFKSPYKPVYIEDRIFIVQTPKGLNYLDNTGKLLLSKSYKWVSTSGYLAINAKNEVVIFDKQGHEHKYYTP